MIVFLVVSTADLQFLGRVIRKYCGEDAGIQYSVPDPGK